jgi:GTPase
VDSGKSTLVGVLSQGARGAPLLDNGRGSSRMAVFRHKHEIETGHTSSISLQTLAYDADGKGNVQAGLAALRGWGWLCSVNCIGRLQA